MTTAALLLTAFGLLAAAAMADVTLPRGSRAWRNWPYLLVATGSVLIAVAGFRADLGHGGTLDLGTTFGFGRTVLRADPLAGLFLALTGVVATPVALSFPGWARHPEAAPYRGLATAVALTVAAVLVIVLADNAFVFLFGWESLSVAFFLLTGYRRDQRGQATASMLTFGFSKTSGSLLLIAFLLLAGATGSFHLADWTSVTGARHDTAYGLAVAGFAAKVGVVPLQVWMPAGYGAAPGPARALMSAVAANAGFYGMWRTLAVLGRPPEWLAVVLVLLAAFTALLGIAHAAVQRDLQRVIAYSSVENGGLIAAGFGIALAGAASGERPLVALGLLTGSLQMVAHAFAKSSLFLSSALIEQRAGTRDLDELRGVAADAPLPAAAFAVGAFTLAGLPLTLGFVSEWFLLESVMQLFRLDSLTLQLSLAVAGALIALAIGFAGFTFVRLVGLTILSRRRTRGVGPTGLGLGARLGLLFPAAACIGLAAVTPWEIRFLAHGLSPIAPVSQTTGALAQPWVLGPVYPDFSVLSPSWLAVELPILAALVVVFVALASRGGFARVRRVPTWRSATGGVAGDARYTAFAFANPTRHVLGNLLLTRKTLSAVEREERAEEDADTVFTGPDMPAGEQDQARPTAALEGAHHVHATYSADVVEVVETLLYRPLLAPLARLITVAKRLQSGRLDAYISYLLIVVVALIAVVVGMS